MHMRMLCLAPYTILYNMCLRQSTRIVVSLVLLSSSSDVFFSFGICRVFVRKKKNALANLSVKSILHNIFRSQPSCHQQNLYVKSISMKILPPPPKRHKQNSSLHLPNKQQNKCQSNRKKKKHTFLKWDN